MEKFRQLGIIEPILKSIQGQNFSIPSEIQEKAIPLILEGKDVIAGAATGSGKTLAFAASIIKNSEQGLGLQSLILVPTRELAEQVSRVLRKFSEYKYLEVVVVYGGVSIIPQIEQLRRADVVIATPGRLLDHINRRTVNLEKLKILVLDEADRMLDMGFEKDVSKIIKRCPAKRQTLLFSATISGDVFEIARKYMINPVEVSAESYVDASKLTQIYYDVEDNKKFSLLVHLLKNEKARLVMVFCNTQRNTDFVADNLNNNGITALSIHGGHSQNQRTRTMERFSSETVSVLVCTDVAARGLDIKGISHVYNYDLPKDSKEYVHRIGRTARAGKDGKVINILANRDYENFSRINKTREFIITKEETPEVEPIFVRLGRRSFNRTGFRRFGQHGSSRFRQGFRRLEGRRFSRGNFRSRDNDSDDSRDNHSHGHRQSRNNSFGRRFKSRRY